MNTTKPWPKDLGRRGDDLDALLDDLRQQREAEQVSAIDACVTPGVMERPPVPGVSYVAFSVHPPRPGPVVLPIAHCEGEQIVLDLIRDGLTIADAANLTKAYGVAEVESALSEGDGLDLAHAGVGAIARAKRAAPC
jgi:hypothetical protein